jgi:hypothetical protein
MFGVREQLELAVQQGRRADHRIGARGQAIAAALAERGADFDAVDVLGILGDDVEDTEQRV